LIKKFILLITLILVGHLVFAQQRYKVSNYGLDVIELKKINLDKTKLYDSTQIKKEVLKFINTQRSLGYIYTNLDKIEFTSTGCNLYFYIGPKYKYKFLPHDTETQYLFDVAGIDNRIKSIDSLSTVKQINKLLQYLNDNGYPFANIEINKIESRIDEIVAKLIVNKGKLIIFDSISYPSTININKKFIHKYLGIQQGKPYSHSLILNTQKKLKELPFIRVDTFPTVTFIEDKAIVNLPVSKKGASSFDFILGFIPKKTPLGQQWDINGDITAELINKLGQGEVFSFKGRQYGENDKQINLSLNYPYILGTLFGFDGQFELFQNRNLSTDAVGNIGLLYQYTGTNSIKFSWNSKTSRLSNIDTNAIKNTNKLPLNLDYNFNALSFGFNYKNLDYRFNPRQGFNGVINVNVGARQIKENFQITSLKTTSRDFKTAYDTLKSSKYQFSLMSSLEYFFPISNWSTFRLANNTGLRISQGLLLENENIRIGGNRLLRGFDELSILTDKYSIFTSEFRIILEKNSYITLPFIEYSFVNLNRGGNKNMKNGFALGAGLNFSTQAGIFNFVIATSNNFEKGLKFDESKIHFGYINLF
jgi:hypothetical protein